MPGPGGTGVANSTRRKPRAQKRNEKHAARTRQRANEEAREPSGRNHNQWFPDIPLAVPGPPLGRPRKGGPGKKRSSENKKNATGSRRRRSEARRRQRANEEARGPSGPDYDPWFIEIPLAVPEPPLGRPRRGWPEKKRSAENKKNATGSRRRRSEARRRHWANEEARGQAGRIMIRALLKYRLPFLSLL